MLDHYLNTGKNSTSVLKKMTGYLLLVLFRLAPGKVGPWLLRQFFQPGIAIQSDAEKAVWAAGIKFEFESHGIRGETQQ